MEAGGSVAVAVVGSVGVAVAAEGVWRLAIATLPVVGVGSVGASVAIESV